MRSFTRRRESQKNSAFVADGSTQVQKDLPAIFSSVCLLQTDHIVRHLFGLMKIVDKLELKDAEMAQHVTPNLFILKNLSFLSILHQLSFCRQRIKIILQIRPVNTVCRTDAVDVFLYIGISVTGAILFGIRRIIGIQVPSLAEGFL